MKRTALVTIIAALALLCAASARPPLIQIDPIPDQSIGESGTYTYQATYTIEDPPCFSFATFSLYSGPSGMTVSSSGYISWPIPGGFTTHPVTIQATAYSECGGPPQTFFESFKLTC